MSTVPQYRADHVGSFLRPPELLAAIAGHAEQQVDDDAVRAAADAAILRLLELQREVGVDVYSDGEYRRSWFAGGWQKAVAGLVTATGEPPRYLGWKGPNRDAAREMTATLAARSIVGAAPLRQADRFAEDEAAFLREHAPGPFKITLSGVVSQALRWYQPGVSDAAYATRAALAEDLARMLAGEVAQLVDEGVSYVQLDSLVYVIQLADPDHRQRLVEAGIDPENVLSEAIAADNCSLAPARGVEGVVTGLHMCRGNNRSSWSAEGGYDAIAERAFAELEVDRLLLEYDSDRAGGFEPLRFVPDDKVVVLGLVSSKTPVLESQDGLLRRIDEASRYVPVERLALSPQCGFASTLKGNLLGWDDQRRKLELVVDTARRVWG